MAVGVTLGASDGCPIMVAGFAVTNHERMFSMGKFYRLELISDTRDSNSYRTCSLQTCARRFLSSVTLGASGRTFSLTVTLSAGVVERVFQRRDAVSWGLMVAVFATLGAVRVGMVAFSTFLSYSHMFSMREPKSTSEITQACRRSRPFFWGLVASLATDKLIFLAAKHNKLRTHMQNTRMRGLFIFLTIIFFLPISSLDYLLLLFVQQSPEINER